ncbi:3'-5' exonuclease [Sphingobacterium sp. N143]|uniref:3'-5' exonuclease n=1 Tax=Sphingobacterium sp. N143 TaxID=2746727 RepID=UPI0025780C8F|nr:3'-5' exonuclease [Sphingobacterium sp. N143]MDM1293636.1 3'-5' exonuclease [Sphingobacterium sp. N143]
MKKYLLFLDTETSGLPKKWNKKFTDGDNWPHVLQVAWIIFDAAQQEIKRTNKYIYEPLIPISPASEQIHGLTPPFLMKYGEKKKDVLRKLSHDIKKYQPQLVGHFLSFDLQVLSAEFYRSHLPIPFSQLDYFCTLLHSKRYVKNPNMVHLPLSLLHESLFTTLPDNMHNAEMDAEITAKCYFEMIHRQELSDQDIKNQQSEFDHIF